MKTKLAPILFFLSALIGFGQYNVQYDVTNYNLRQTRIMGSNVLAGSNIVVVRNTNNGVLTVHGLGASSNTVLLWIGTVGTNSTNYAATIGTNATNYASLASSTVGANATNYASLAVGTLGTNSTNYANSMFGMFGTNSTNYAVQLVGDLGTNTTNYAANGLGTLGTNATNYANWVSGSVGTNTTNALVGKMDMLNGLSTNQQTWNQTNNSPVCVNGATFYPALGTLSNSVAVSGNGISVFRTNNAAGDNVTIGWTNGAATIATVNGVINIKPASWFNFGDSGTLYWQSVSGDLTPIANGSRSLGISSQRIKDIYSSGSAYFGSGFFSGKAWISNAVNLLGGLALGSNPKSTNSYVMTSNDCVVPVRSGCTNVMLPLAATCSNQVFTIKDADGWGAVSNIYICAQAGDWIESGTNALLEFAFDSVKLMSLGDTNWIILGWTRDRFKVGSIMAQGNTNNIPFGWVWANGGILSDVRSPFNGQAVYTLHDDRYLMGSSEGGTGAFLNTHTHSITATTNTAPSGEGQDIFAVTGFTISTEDHRPKSMGVIYIEKVK